MNFASQAEMVRGSLLIDEQRTHRHDAPARRTQVVPGEQRAASHVGSVPARVQARGGEETGCDGCLPAPTQVCECSHLAGDHSDGRNRSLTPAPLGLCHVTGCACREYRAAECGCPVINGDRVEQASCPEHGWENHPVMRRVPGTTRHV